MLAARSHTIGLVGAHGIEQGARIHRPQIHSRQRDAANGAVPRRCEGHAEVVGIHVRLRAGSQGLVVLDEPVAGRDEDPVERARVAVTHPRLQHRHVIRAPIVVRTEQVAVQVAVEIQEDLVEEVELRR